jgi:hypothetical protein
MLFWLLDLAMLGSIVARYMFKHLIVRKSGSTTNLLVEMTLITRNVVVDAKISILATYSLGDNAQISLLENHQTLSI